MPSADQVPVKTAHSTMRWHKWVVLIAGSIGSALRAVRPPNLDRHHAGCPARARLPRKCDGIPISFTLGDANQAWRQLLKEGQNVAALQLATDDHPAGRINSVRSISA